MSSTPNENEMVGQMRGGLTFLKTKEREKLVEFYMQKLGMRVWLEQDNISILSHGNFLLGFHQIQEGEEVGPEIAGMYTFVYPSRHDVDVMYTKLKDANLPVDGPPRDNKKYGIYQFFSTDAEQRKLEFQAFLHPVDVVSSEVE